MPSDTRPGSKTWLAGEVYTLITKSSRNPVSKSDSTLCVRVLCDLSGCTVNIPLHLRILRDRPHLQPASFPMPAPSNIGSNRLNSLSPIRVSGTTALPETKFPPRATRTPVPCQVDRRWDGLALSTEPQANLTIVECGSVGNSVGWCFDPDASSNKQPPPARRGRLLSGLDVFRWQAPPFVC